jgi:iron(III) transport system substrate-binding protein
MEPSMGLYSVFSVAKGAPHVNAAKLLVEFLISKEGQELFRAADYIPVSPEVPPRDPGLRPDTGGFRAIFFTPDDMEATIAQRQRIYGEIFK